MKSSFVIAQKDFSSYFRSWTGVAVTVFYWLLSGLFFSLLVLGFAKLSLEAGKNPAQDLSGFELTRFVFSSFYLNMSAILAFVVPILSMRAFAEERKQETLELLFTYPLSDFDIVWGKFLGMLWFLKWLTLPVFLYLGLAHWLGGQLDWGPVLIGLAGFFFLATGYLSLGLFLSSVSENQVISAMATFGSLLLFWLLDWVTGVTDGFWGQFFSALSPMTHFREFTVGILDLGNIVYFVFFLFYFLFLTMRSIEVRNWKG